MDEFEQAQSHIRPGNTGWWAKVIPQLDDERRDALLKACENRDISHTAIAVVLKRWGYDISYQQVGHYRRVYVW